MRDEAEYFDPSPCPWDNLSLACCSYNSEIERAAIWVLEATAQGIHWCDDVAKLTGLDPLLVELLKSAFSEHPVRAFEYGTSPRGAWVAHGFDVDAYISQWRSYYAEQWGEECEPLPTLPNPHPAQPAP